jgi:endonuclease/exonuclease/phosphatase family metal-dependent hydrolase
LPSPLPLLIAASALLCAFDASCDAADSGPAAPPLVIEVMSFNLRWGPDREPNDWATREPLVVELLREEAPAVAGLQESRPEYVDALLSQLPRYAAYPAVGSRQNSILYCRQRFRLDASTSDADNARVDAPAADWGPGSVRVPRSVRLVDERSGLAFYVYNNHFDHRFAESRHWSAVVLMGRVRARAFADPVILTGDFNAGADDPALALLRNGAPPDESEGGIGTQLRFVDSFRELHPDERWVGTFHDFLGVHFGPRVDYVFAGPGIRVRNARILHFERDGRYPSDHFPVVATLEIEATGAPASRPSPEVADGLEARAAARTASGGCPSVAAP